MTVGEAEAKARNAQNWTQSVSLDDTPESIAHSPLVTPDTIQEAVEKLESVLTRGTEEHQEVRVFSISIKHKTPIYLSYIDIFTVLTIRSHFSTTYCSTLPLSLLDQHWQQMHPIASSV